MRLNHQLEFNDLVKEMLENESYMELQEYAHHGEEDIIMHNMQVASLTFKLAKTFKLDVRSATRGAMLHDFFHYNWKEYKKGVFDFRHTRNHPIISLENAKANFEINDVEADIIVKHMFPLTPALPKYKEAFLVTFCDKMVATLNFASSFMPETLIPRIVG